MLLQGELGELAPGAAADLLLVEGDPLEDIAVLTNPNIRLVIKAGLLAKVGGSLGGDANIMADAACMQPLCRFLQWLGLAAFKPVAYISSASPDSPRQHTTSAGDCAEML